MNEVPISDQIMIEVSKLQQSISEYCPEIVSYGPGYNVPDIGDEMDRLIEHRTQLLIKNAERNVASKDTGQK